MYWSPEQWPGSQAVRRAGGQAGRSDRCECEWECEVADGIRQAVRCSQVPKQAGRKQGLTVEYGGGDASGASGMPRWAVDEVRGKYLPGPGVPTVALGPYLSS